MKVNMTNTQENIAMNTGNLPTILGQTTTSAKSHRPDPDPDYIIQGLLYPGQVSMFAGPSNLGKSSIVAALASQVAIGQEIAGMRVSRAAVLYIAAEAAKGILNRAYPYLSRNAGKAAAFDVLDMPVDLSDPKMTEQLANDAIRYKEFHGCDDLLIVFDTLNLCMGDGDENSSRDTGRVMSNAGYLAKETNAHVLIVHHMGTSESSRPRGSSVLTGNVDTGMTLHKADKEQPDGTIFIKVHKQREEAKPDPIAFQIKPFAIGKNRHGEVTTVPWAVAFKPDRALADIERSRSRTTKPSGQSIADQRRADMLRVINALAEEDPTAWHKPKAVGEMTGEPFNGIRANADTMRKKVRQALDQLLESGDVEECEDGVRKRCKTKQAQENTSSRQLH